MNFAVHSYCIELSRSLMWALHYFQLTKLETNWPFQTYRILNNIMPSRKLEKYKSFYLMARPLEILFQL